MLGPTASNYVLEAFFKLYQAEPVDARHAIMHPSLGKETGRKY